MNLKIPPALQTAIFAALMWIMKKATAITHFEFGQQKIVSWVIFGIGVSIGILAVYTFKKAKTTTNPLDPGKASKLVIVSIYKVSRNPMYLGMLFILIAFAIRLGNLFTFFVPILYVWYITTFQIKPEEKALTKLFKDNYIDYYRRVRRWV